MELVCRLHSASLCPFGARVSMLKGREEVFA